VHRPVDRAQVGNRNINGGCAEASLTSIRFKDIHIGIITSSLGNHGATGVCDDAVDMARLRSFPHNDDHGHLLARTDMDMVGFHVPEQGLPQLEPQRHDGPDVGGHRHALPDDGARRRPARLRLRGSLEAIYHFSHRPNPYLTVGTVPLAGSNLGQAVAQGTDMALLTQRNDFLRPDSLVAVMMITDENDCSVQDGGQGFYSIVTATQPRARRSASPRSATGRRSAKTTRTMRAATTVRAATGELPGQVPGSGMPGGGLDRDQDQENLRCWDQKRRYGHDFLYRFSATWMASP